MMASSPITFSFLRDQTIGIDAPVRTPFGERLLVYADFTASGRMLAFVEDYLRDLAVLYANSHTEDSLTGRATTHRLRDAERRIKEHVNAGPEGRVISCGTGSTGAIHKMQEILGVALPPATRHFLGNCLGRELSDALCEKQPVIFVGPYEHHSNEVTWREGLATVMEVDLDADGRVDLAHLQRLLEDERFADRPRIGSFSAASNVTGVRTQVHEVARLLHEHDALACFDFAASAPYVDIDMNPAGDPLGALDAVFISPHKFLGGPGSAGLLIFNERVYPQHLSPSVGGGGTVVYVNPDGHAFVRDVEEREKAGTPGILQTFRAALALDIKAALGSEAIQERERTLLGRAFARWREEPKINILGGSDPGVRIGIVSFTLADDRGGWLHPRFVTTLLDDLFGIQSRAGCSCAGPYAHRILGIGPQQAARLMALSESGYHGIKPGWSRVGFHYTMDDADADYVIEAVLFVARHGALFLPEYDFNVRTGTWAHKDAAGERAEFSLEAAVNAGAPRPEPVSSHERGERFRRYLDVANELAAERASGVLQCATLNDELEPHRYFCVAEGCVVEGSEDDAFCGGF
jgi:selenocysteine lyase/cysteine desulfurase